MIEEVDDVRGEGRKEVIGILQKHGPLKNSEILEKCELLEDSKQLSNVLYQLRIGKQVVKLDDGNWARAGEKVSAGAKPREAAKQIAALHRGDAIATGDGKATAFKFRDTSAVEKILQKAADDAQAAIDEYVSSLGDPGILGPLRAARDQARLALENYRKARAA